MKKYPTKWTFPTREQMEQALQDAHEEQAETLEEAAKKGEDE